MSTQRTLKVNETLRLDQFLVRIWPQLDRRTTRDIIQTSEILVNGRAARKAGQYLHAGDTVTVSEEVDALVTARSESSEEASYIAASRPPLQVVHEDGAFLVVDKAAGVPVRPSRKQAHGALTQQLAERYPEQMHLGGVGRAGLLTRLDQDASGLVLFARTESAYRSLRRDLKRQRVIAVYSVLVEGRLTGAGAIDQPIGNVKHTRKRLAVAREGRPARTDYRGQRHYREQGQDYTLLEIRPASSRLHQIRVHLSWYGFPMVGDQVYGSRRQPLLADRLFIHLGILEFPHPVTGEVVHVESALPAELHSVLRYLRRPRM